MEAEFENGFAVVGDGEWLVGAGQPAAILGRLTARPAPKVEGVPWWRRLFAPDRFRLSCQRLEGRMWCAAAERPFLTRLDLGERVCVVTEKLLVAPASARKGSRLVKAIPFSFRDAVCATELEIGWAVCATRSRVAKIVVKEGETLGVKPRVVVAWTGNPPTGYCPKLRTRDLFLPRAPKCLLLNFHGPAIVWVEGASTDRKSGSGRWGMGRD